MLEERWDRTEYASDPVMESCDEVRLRAEELSAIRSISSPRNSRKFFLESSRRGGVLARNCFAGRSPASDS